MTEREAIRKALRENPQHATALAKMVERGLVSSTKDIEPTEPVTIVGGLHHANIDGAKQFRCVCGNLVWVSPSTQEVIANRPAGYTIFCPACFIKLIEGAGEPSKVTQ